MKKTLYIQLILLLFPFLSLHAQDNVKVWHWMEQLGGAGWDMPNGMVSDSEDNIYIAGGFTETLEGGKKSVESSGNRDIYVARYTQEGRLEWLWQAGGQYMDKITAIKEAPDNDIYIAGMVDGEVSFDKTEVEGEGKRLFVSRITKKGACEWVTTIDYSGVAAGYLLETDVQGNLVLGGVFTDSLSCNGEVLTSHGHQDIFLVRLDQNGQLSKMTCYGANGKEKLTALSSDSLGHMYLAAQYNKSFSLGGNTVKANSTAKSGNSVVFQIDTGFNVNWYKTMYSPSYATIKGLACDLEDNLLLGGTFNHTLQVDTLSYYTQGLNDLFVAKADTSGHITWLNTFGGKKNDDVAQVKLNKLGGLLVLGSYTDSLQLDTITLLSDSYYSDAFVAQINTKGDVTWSDALQGDRSNRASAAAIDSEGNLFLTGTFNGTIKGGNTEYTTLGSEDIYVAKYYDCPTIENAIDHPDYICQGNTAILSVNNNYSQIVWNDSVVDITDYEVSDAGIYYVNMVDEKGCVVSDTISMQLALAQEFSLGKDTSLLVNQSIRLTGPKAEDYEWQDGSVSQSYLAYCEEGIAGIYNYHLTITDTVGCQWSDDIDIEFYEEPGSADLSEGERLISVFPNPIEDEFVWSVELDEEAYIQVEMRNSSGVLLYSQKVERYIPNEQYTIDIVDYQPGIYYFSIASNGDRITKKLVKL